MEEDEEMDWETSYVVEIKKMWHDTLPPSPLPNTSTTATTAEVHKSPLIVVPDTNIWIGYPDLIKTLLNTEFVKGSLSIIIIPWIVLQELDIKKGNGSNSEREQKQAKSATKFMHELLLKNNLADHPRVIGQRASEAASSENKFEARNADDQILLCALQCSDRYPNSLVVFVTNDVNLLNKALIETVSDKTKLRNRDLILVCDSTSVLAKIREKLSNSTESQGGERQFRIPKRRLKPAHENINGKIQQQPLQLPTPSVITPTMPRRTSLKRSLDVKKETRFSLSHPSIQTVPYKKQFRDWTAIPKCETFESILKLLKDTFSHIIESKMKEDFGDTWLYTLKVKPPWTLESAIKCIILHWIAVFSFVFGSKALVHAESLQELLKEYNGTISNQSSKPEQLQQYEEDIMEMSVSLFNAGKLNKSSSISKDEMLNCRQAVLDYLKRNKM